MDMPELRGPRLFLRPPRPQDVVDRLAAGRDPEFWRLVGGTGPWPGPLTAAEAERWHAHLSAQPNAWVIEHDGHCIGEVRLHGLNHSISQAHYAIGLFRPEDRGRGLGSEATRLALGHAFDALGLLEVRVRVLAFNAGAIACYRRCGFREVGRESVALGPDRTVDILMAVTASEFTKACAG